MKKPVKIDKTTKRWIVVLLTALALFLTADLCARDRGVWVTGGTKRVAACVWHGVSESDPAFLPVLALMADHFSAPASGSVDFDTRCKETDLPLACVRRPRILSVATCYRTAHSDDRSFVVDNHPPHRIGVGARWVGWQKEPPKLSGYTILFGAADGNDKDAWAYTSCCEAAPPFMAGAIDLKADIGLGLCNAPDSYCSGGRDCCVHNIFLHAGRRWRIQGMDSVPVGIVTDGCRNPAPEQVNFTGGLSRRM